MDLEEKYLEKIWTIINNEDYNRLMLSWDEQSSIMEILKEYHKEQLALCNVSCSLPSKEEIIKEARKEENYIGNECDVVAAEKGGKYHGFLRGVEWLSSKLK